MCHPSPSPAQTQPSVQARGFTLLEALVVLALLGILVGMAAPAMSALRAKHQLQAQAEGFLDSLVLARSEALRRQQRISCVPKPPVVAVTPRANGSKAGWCLWMGTTTACRIPARH